METTRTYCWGSLRLLWTPADPHQLPGTTKARGSSLGSTPRDSSKHMALAVPSSCLMHRPLLARFLAGTHGWWWDHGQSRPFAGHTWLCPCSLSQPHGPWDRGATAVTSHTHAPTCPLHTVLWQRGVLACYVPCCHPWGRFPAALPREQLSAVAMLRVPMLSCRHPPPRAARSHPGDRGWEHPAMPCAALWEMPPCQPFGEEGMALPHPLPWAVSMPGGCLAPPAFGLPHVPAGTFLGTPS